MSKKLNVAFFGTPDFCLSSLEALLHHPLVNLKMIVTMPDRPAGRGNILKAPPVAEFACQNSIALHQSENINKDEVGIEKLKNCELDLIIVLAFAQFLSKTVRELPKLGCFNIHTSLLPKYRGAAPIQHALLNNDSSTGVCLQRMVKEMDAGDVAILKPVNIDPTDNFPSLYTKLKFHSALVLHDFISAIAENKITYTVQNQNDISFAPSIKKEDGRITPSKDSIKTAIAKLKAFTPWPGIFCQLEDGRTLKVLELEQSNYKMAAGACSLDGNMFNVGFIDGSLRFKTIQLEGKKACNDIDFANGLKNSKCPIKIS